jgi:HNH endonuclease
LRNSFYEQIAFKLRSIRARLSMDQRKFAQSFQIPLHDLERFENGLEMPAPMAMAYLSAIAANPDEVLHAVSREEISLLSASEQSIFETILSEKIADMIALEGGCDPNDLILWCSSNGGKLPADEFHVRYPPKTAVKPCHVKCLKCRKIIDVPFKVLELHEDDNEAIYDVDCPHCWSANAFTEPSTVQKLVNFRRNCQRWINPPVSKSKRIPASLRFRVLERDKFRCTYCGATPQHAALHVDHKTPLSEGGTNEIENLVAACADCNLGKGSNCVELTT